MTLFEYLAVAVSIVLGLAATRLMDALPHVFAKGRRYWIHATITCACLGNIGNAWWIMWSYQTVTEWTSARFFLVLGISGLHYSIAALLAPSAAASVASWRKYYWEIRVRLYSLTLVWMALIAVQSWILLDISWWHPTRLVELVVMSLGAAGVASTNPRIHVLIAMSMAAGLVILVVTLFASAAPLAKGGS
jgi:hypothetical protein